MIRIETATIDDWRTIRDLRLDALAKAAGMLNASGEPAPEDDTGWQEYLTKRLSDGNIIFIAYDGETPVAAGNGKPNPYKADAYVLHSLWVTPDARGKGIAKLLNAARVKHAQQQGYKYAQACCNIRNEKSMGLYRSLGYTEMPEPSEFRPAQAAHEVVFYLAIAG